MLNKDKLVSEQFPELNAEYSSFKRLELINREKIDAIQIYLKRWNEGSIGDIKKQFKQLRKLTVRDKSEQALERQYELRFLQKIRLRRKNTQPSRELEEFIASLEKLSECISKQINLIRADQLMWKFRTDFQEFILLVLEEQRIIKGDENFLNKVSESFKEQISKEIVNNAKEVLNIGHMGARGICLPGNTLNSMKIALKWNVDMIEFDAHMCKTGELVVIHDHFVDKAVKEGSGRVEELTFAELRKMELKESGEIIPTLQEVFEFLKGKCKMDIDIKAYGAKKEVIGEFAHRLVGLLRKYKISSDDVLIESFSHEILRDIKTINPALHIGIVPLEDFGMTKLQGLKHFIRYRSMESPLINRIINLKERFAKNFVETSLHLGAEIMSLPMHIANEDLIKYAHANNLKIYVWTVNNPYFMIQLIIWGVDGIFTDRPDILRKVKEYLVKSEIPEFKNLFK